MHSHSTTVFMEGVRIDIDAENENKELKFYIHQLKNLLLKQFSQKSDLS